MDKSTEWARKNGMCPDIFYYQLNGKSATDNYINQKKKFMEKLNQKEEIKIDEKELEKAIEKALNEILKDM